MPIVPRGTQQVPKRELLVAQISERQRSQALPLSGSIIHRHQDTILVRLLPGVPDELLPGRVVLPCRPALEPRSGFLR